MQYVPDDESREAAGTDHGDPEPMRAAVECEFGGIGRYFGRPDRPPDGDPLASAVSWREACLVVDDQARVVALLPTPDRSEIVTASDRWSVNQRWRRAHWELVVTRLSDSRRAASVEPSLRPNAYRIRLGTSSEYVLVRRLASSDWKLRSRRHRSELIDVRRVWSNVWSFEVCDGIAQHRLALLVPLVLLVAKADSAIPFVGGGGG